MPQQSLLSDHPAMTSLVIEVLSYPLTQSVDDVRVTVKIGTGAKPAKARWAGTLVGIEADYLDTLVTTATATYMYGETTRAVAKACADVCRLARKHRRAHEY